MPSMNIQTFAQRLRALAIVGLTASACASPVVESASAEIREELALSRDAFPRDEEMLLADLQDAASSDARTLRAYMDTLRRDRPRAAGLLEGARQDSEGSLHRAVLYAIGEVADASSIRGLEQELARCPSTQVVVTVPSRPPRRCPFDGGDLDESCMTPESESFLATPSDALFALDAFDAVVARTPLADNGRRFYGTVESLLADAECHPAVVAAAGSLYVRRSAEPVAAQRRLDELLGDRPHLARVTPIAPSDLPSPRRTTLLSRSTR